MRTLLLIAIFGVLFCSYREISSFIEKKTWHDTEKKQHLDEYYKGELKFDYREIYERDQKSSPLIYKQWAGEAKEKTESHMSQDGYDWAEIDSMETIAREQARKELKEEVKRQSEGG